MSTTARDADIPGSLLLQIPRRVPARSVKADSGELRQNEDEAGQRRRSLRNSEALNLAGRLVGRIIALGVGSLDV